MHTFAIRYCIHLLRISVESQAPKPACTDDRRIRGEEGWICIGGALESLSMGKGVSEGLMGECGEALGIEK